MSALIKFYGSCLANHPILTKSISSMVIGSAGDVAAQYLTRDKTQSFHVDTFRTFRIACMNFGYGFMSHYWYNALDKMVVSKGMRAVISKMVIDQFLFVPTCQILFYSGNSIMEAPHDQPQAAVRKLKQVLLPSLLTNYSVWPLLQVINFKFVPLQYQVLYLSCGLFFWNIFLSHMANKKEKKEYPCL
ncbi:hypothetical protein WA588_000085 [Blastocystis sp. NMH]